MPHDNELHSIIEKYQILCESDKNKEKLSFWVDRPIQQVVDPFKFRGKARPIDRKKARFPILNTDLQPQASCRLYDVNVEEYYKDPATHLATFLKRRIYIFENADDDSPLLPGVPIYLGSEWELTLVGMKQKYFDTIDPQLEYKAVIDDEEDLNKLEYPKFYDNPAMDIAFRFYEDFCRYTEDTILTPLFPEWWVSPLAYMIPLRGHEKLLMDAVIDPEFFKKQLKFSVEARKGWISKRAKYLGIDIPKAIIRNDEVSPPMVSPEIYRELIYPYEEEISEFCGGISYWHGCGDNSRLFSIAKGLKPDLLHVSPWSELPAAAEEFKGSGTAFEVSVSQEEAVQSDKVDEKFVREYVSRAIETLDGKISAWYLDCGSLRGMRDSIDDDMTRMNWWFKVARGVGNSF